MERKLKWNGNYFGWIQDYQKDTGKASKNFMKDTSCYGWIQAFMKALFRISYFGIFLESFQGNCKEVYYMVKDRKGYK